VSVGLAWTEASIIGGWQKIVTYAAAIMSGAGFTWCYLIIAMLIASYFNVLPAKYIEAMGSLGYLIIVFPILGAGLAITINSWAYAIKNRSFTSFGVGAYNTFAQTYNMFSALNAIPNAIGNVMETLFSGHDSDDNGKGLLGLIVIAIVIVVTVLGALTTITIVKWVANMDRNKSVQKIKNAYQTS
jgi:hypothetical protein